MEFRDMENIIADYVDCAVRLKKAQFDGVNIHAAPWQSDAASFRRSPTTATTISAAVSRTVAVSR